MNQYDSMLVVDQLFDLWESENEYGYPLLDEDAKDIIRNSIIALQKPGKNISQYSKMYWDLLEEKNNLENRLNEIELVYNKLLDYSYMMDKEESVSIEEEMICTNTSKH
jgi:hypothetical protein